MLWIFLLLSIFLFLVVYLSFAPLSVVIDTERNQYYIRYHWLAGLYIENENSSFSVWLKVLFWKRQLKLNAGRLQPARPKKMKTQPSKKIKPFSWKKPAAVLRSFRIKTCKVVIDTDDMPLNGILYPLFYLAGRYTGHEFRISFTGETKIVLEIENNLARMVRAWIRS